MTGIVTASWISRIFSGSDMRATPPCTRMSAGTRSSAITATAPASSAIFAWSASTTSMITPPLSISARPLLTRMVPISLIDSMLPGAGLLFFDRERQHVLAVGPQVCATAVRELDDDHRPALRSDQECVRIDDL